MFSLNLCYGRDASCANPAISGTDRCKSCTNVRPETKPQPLSMFALNMCFGKDGSCTNPVISGTSRCKSCSNAKQDIKPQPSIDRTANALDVLRKMGNSIPSYCELCNRVGMFGMKCNCGGYYMPK